MSQCKSVSLSAVRPLTRQLLAVVMASAFLAGSAVAQTRAPQPTTSSVGMAGQPGTATIKGQAATITYKQKTSYDFDDDQVEGAVVQPDTDLITGRSKSNHESMVRPRTTFQPEMLKSVESL